MSLPQPKPRFTSAAPHLCGFHGASKSHVSSLELMAKHETYLGTSVPRETRVSNAQRHKRVVLRQPSATTGLAHEEGFLAEAGLDTGKQVCGRLVNDPATVVFVVPEQSARFPLPRVGLRSCVRPQMHNALLSCDTCGWSQEDTGYHSNTRQRPVLSPRTLTDLGSPYVSTVPLVPSITASTTWRAVQANSSSADARGPSTRENLNCVPVDMSRTTLEP